MCIQLSDYPIRRDDFSLIEKGLKFFKDKGNIFKSVCTTSFGEVLDDAIIGLLIFHCYKSFIVNYAKWM